MNLGQLFMIGVPADGDLTAVAELQPGGVILMGRNAGTPAEVHRLTRNIRDACAVPPLIAVDQEGGRVQRLTDGFTTVPPMSELAGDGARAVGLMAMTVAAELRAAGIQLNLAPVCDVPAHAQDTVIASRAFSSDPIRASLLAAEYIRAAQPTVLCCAKHFPGHGGVGVDSHQGLPTFESTGDDLSAVHLQPFRAAQAAGVAAMMVGHIAIPALDASGVPATYSRAVVTELLREQLHYDGLVLTDDMEMKALDQTDPGANCVRALASGCDMVMFCHASDKAAAGLRAVRAVVDSGALSGHQVTASLARVERAKRQAGILKA